MPEGGYSLHSQHGSQRHIRGAQSAGRSSKAGSYRLTSVLFFVGGILAVIFIVAAISSWRLKQEALVSCQKETFLDIARVNGTFQQHTDSVKIFASHVANTSVLNTSLGKLQKYTSTQTKTELLYENHTPLTVC